MKIASLTLNFHTMRRKDFLRRLYNAFKVHPAVGLLGPRQCGKTTLAQQFKGEYSIQWKFHYFDLEDPRDLARLENPMLALEKLEGCIIIDEVQLRPHLFPILRVLIDQKKERKFLLLGSASRDLLQQSSESLAGRIKYLELTPFTYSEVDDFPRLWLRGGFPLSYLADSDENSAQWREAYISTFLERDIPNLGLRIPPRTLRRFGMMLTHYHGMMFNSSEIGKSFGIAHTTSRHYLDILSGIFMIRELQPWFENIKKRQIKTPKIYFRDSGLFHSLLGISTQDALNVCPKIGISWEGFAIEEIIRFHEATFEESYFWGVHSQAELDLLLIKKGKRLGFEMKYMDAPTLTESMFLSLEILNLEKLVVIYPGSKDYDLDKKIHVVGLENYLKSS